MMMMVILLLIKMEITSNKNYHYQEIKIGHAVQFTTGSKEGTYTPDVQNYIVKLHVKATGPVTVGGKTLTKYQQFR